MGKRGKYKVGTQVEFSFAGQTLRGEIKTIEIDNSYSVTTQWYKIEHEDGTIYPLKTDDETVKRISKNN